MNRLIDRNKIRELKEHGKTYQEIADIFNVSYQFIYAEINKQKCNKYGNKYYLNNKQKINEYSLKYQKENRDTYNSYMRNYLQNNYRQKYKEIALRKNTEIKQIVLSHYSNGKCICTKCGFSDIRALSIDHIDGGGYLHCRLTSDSLYRWLIKNNFPEGFQTLCMNCQFIKRYENNELKRNDLDYNKLLPQIVELAKQDIDFETIAKQLNIPTGYLNSKSFQNKILELANTNFNS